MPGAEERENMLLGCMLEHVMRGKDTVSFKQLSKDLSFMDRTTSWRDSWKILLNKKQFIEIQQGASVFTGECRLTKAGKDHAATPKYLEYVKENHFTPQTNDEHQARIKKRLKNDRGREIFDLLLTHGSLSRKELSTILHCNDRQHKFSYGLQDLKTRALVEADESAGKAKLRLSNKAFLSPGDRPVTVDVDPMVLQEGALTIEKNKRPRSQDSTKLKKKGLVVEAGDEYEEEEVSHITKKCKRIKSQEASEENEDEECTEYEEACAAEEKCKANKQN